MADIRTWIAAEYESKVANIRITRGAEFVVDVLLGANKFEVGVNQLRPLATALVRIADEIEAKNA